MMKQSEQSVVVHTCNPSDAGSRDERTVTQGQPEQNKS
jgi:hypothetical protein